MLSYFDIFNIFDIFRIGAGGGSGGGGPVIPPYDPTLWVNNMGQFNKPTALSTMIDTRTSAGTVFDHEGLVVTGEPNEIVLDGGRPERNLATSLTTHSIAVESGRTYQISCEGASASTVVLSNAAAGTLTNNGSDRLAFDIAKTATTTTLTLTVAGVLTALQVQDVTGRSNTAPSEVLDLATTEWYSTTNGNSVNSGVVTEAPGTAITPVPQVLMQPLRTNLIKGSRDLTNATWALRGTAVATQTAVGMDGVANGATDISVGPTNADDIYQNVNSTAFKPAAPVVWVKAVTTSGVLRVLNPQSTSEGEWDIDLSAVSTTEFDRIDEEHASVTVVTPFVIGVSGVGGLHFRSTTRVSMIIGNTMSFDSKTIDQIRGTSPIFTETAAVTVDADKLEISDWNNFAPTTSGIMLFAFTPSGDWAALGAEQLVYGGASANLLSRSANEDGLKATDGTSTPSVLSGHTPGTEIIASVYFDADINIFQVGYYEVGIATQHWDASPEPFATLAVDPELLVAKILDGAVTIRGLQIFNGMPAGGVDQASIEAWIEANQEAKINERQS